MSASTRTTRRKSAEAATDRSGPAISRIAVGVDGFSEGEDAVALGNAIADVTGAELMLVAVHLEPLLLPPLGLDWRTLRKEAHEGLRKARATLAPQARIVVESDLSVSRALQRVVDRGQRDLLVMGSSRHGPEGRVRIGKRTRQLLCHFASPLGVAPRGLHKHMPVRLRRIAVGYDGGPEARAALALAGSVAVAAKAELSVHAVIDDRLHLSPWSGPMKVTTEAARWEEAVAAEMDRQRSEVEEAAGATGTNVKVEIDRGRPADALLALSERSDLLVLGSRRWGPMARVLLGSTGEALLHDAACPVIVVPRPPD